MSPIAILRYRSGADWLPLAGGTAPKVYGGKIQGPFSSTNQINIADVVAGHYLMTWGTVIQVKSGGGGDWWTLTWFVDSVNVQGVQFFYPNDTERYYSGTHVLEVDLADGDHQFVPALGSANFRSDAYCNAFVTLHQML